MKVSIENCSNGNTARVDDAGRIQALSVSKSTFQQAAENGDSFNVNTGTINLTSGNESAVLYFKNDSQNEYAIPAIGFLLGNSTGGVGDILATIIKNPITGTIIDNAVNVDIVANKNAGSIKGLGQTAYKGVEGDTLNSGENWYFSLIAGAARPYVIDTGQIVLTPGTSLGVKVTPQAGNTSMNLQIFMSVINNADFVG